MAGGLLQTVDEHTQLAGRNRLALLLFRLDSAEQAFGINVFKVREVIRCPSLTGMPGMHPAVRGCAEIRGKTISVVDLGQAIGFPPLAEPVEGYLIVSEFNRSVQGFLISGVEHIAHRDGKDVLPPPSGTGLGAYVNAVTRVDGQLVSIIDVEQVMAEVGGMMALKVSSNVAPEAPEEMHAKILIADDSALARKQIQSILEQIGVECLVAKDGREALRMLRDGAIDQVAMLVSDIEMPGMDGYALTRAIREDERLRNLHIILHTSLSGGFNESMTEQVGANRFIAKFDADELAQGVLDGLAAGPDGGRVTNGTDFG
jgi:two-component system chemotaxis response regulator CheV